MTREKREWGKGKEGKCCKYQMTVGDWVLAGELTIGCTDVVLQSRTPEIYKMLLTNVTTIIKKENKAKKKEIETYNRDVQ